MEDREFKVMLRNIVSLRPTWTTWDPVQKKNRETEEEQCHCKLCEGKQLSKERPNLGNTIPKKLHYEADITFCCCSWRWHLKDFAECASWEEKLVDREQDHGPQTEYTRQDWEQGGPVFGSQRSKERNKEGLGHVKAVSPTKDLELSFCKWWVSPWGSESRKWNYLFYSLQRASLRAGSKDIHTGASENPSARHMWEPRLALSQCGVGACESRG